MYVSILGAGIYDMVSSPGGFSYYTGSDSFRNAAWFRTIPPHKYVIDDFIAGGYGAQNGKSPANSEVGVTAPPQTKHIYYGASEMDGA